MEDLRNRLRTLQLEEKIESSFYTGEPNILPLLGDYIKIIARKSFKYCACCTVITVTALLFSIWISLSGRSIAHSVSAQDNVVILPSVRSKSVTPHQDRRKIRQVARDIENITKILAFAHGSKKVGEVDKATEVQTGEDRDLRSLPTLTVVVPKANLRAKANIQSETIAEIGAGTQLVIETVNKDWLGVVAPSGERAWIRMDLVKKD